MSQPATLAMSPHSSAEANGTGGTDTTGLIFGGNRLDVFAGVTALLLPLATSPAVYSETFVPKLAVLVVMLAVGTPLLLRLAVRSHVTFPARAACAFLLVALISASTSHAPLVGFFGLYTWGTGWLFWLAVTSCWAIGVSVSARGRHLIASGLLAGVAVNALVAVIQVAGQIHSGILGLYQGQADALMGNPIHLEALLLGGLGILASRVGRGDLRWLVLVALASGAIELSGERFALGLLAALGLYTLVRYRSRAALAYVAVLGAGYALAWLASGAALHSRLTTVEGPSSNPRIAVWKLAAHSLAHNPFFGAGPGETRSAISSIETPALARRLVLGQYFADAHNVVVELAVTVGVLGLLCAALFILGIVRRVRGEFVLFALLVLAVEMVEPLNVGTLPLAALAIGAALPVATVAVGDSRTVRRRLGTLQLVLLVLALGFDGVALAGDAATNTGQSRTDYGSATLGASLLRVWSAPAVAAAGVANFDAINSARPAMWRNRARSLYLEALQRDPTDPGTWFALGETDVQLGQYSAAADAFAHSLRWNPSGAQALTALGLLAERRRDWRVAYTYFARAVNDSIAYTPAIDGLAAARRHLG